MPAATTPPPSPIQGAVEESNGIWVTTAIEQAFEQTRFNINDLTHLPLSSGLWKPCYVPTDQIEPKISDWYQIKSARGLYVVGKCCNGNFYEVAVHESYIPWLLRHKFKFLPYLDFDRTKPADAEVRVYGIRAARRRARISFLRNIINAIRSGRSPGLVSYFRRIVPSPLRVSLEWAILNHEILESDLQIRNKFVLCLLLIALSLNHDYSCPTVVELLEKNQDELLQVFRKDYTDLLHATTSGQTVQFHCIALVRGLFVFCGGRKDVLQQKFHPGYAACDNANFFGSLVSIIGSNRFGSFDTQAMLKALSLSKAVAKDDIHMLDIASLTRQMTTSLPIGFPQGYLDIPAELLYRLGKGQVDQIRVQIAHFYRNQPSLQTPKNNPLVLLTSLIIQDQPHRVLSGWAASDDGWSLYRRLIRDIQHPQTTEQLALTLAALLCYRRLLPYFPNDTTQSIRGCCYLGEFDALISGELSGNERTVLEYMILSFLWALNTFDDDHQGLRQLLATLLDTETTVELRDIFSVQYWVRRMKYRLPHSDAFGKHPSFRLPRGKVAAIPSLWVSKPSLRCYNWWTFAPIVLLLISNLRGLESSLVWTILLFSTCGESLFLVTKYIRLRRLIAQHPDHSVILAHASLCISKFVYTSVFFIVGWTALNALFTLSTICTLQIFLHRVYPLRAQPLRQDSGATWGGVPDVDKALGVDTDR